MNCRRCMLLTDVGHRELDCITALRTELRKSEARVRVLEATVMELRAHPMLVGTYPPRPKDGEPLFGKSPLVREFYGSIKQIPFQDTEPMPVAVKKPLRFVRNKLGWLWEVKPDGSGVAYQRTGSPLPRILDYADVIKGEATPVKGEVWEARICVTHFNASFKVDDWSKSCYSVRELVECGCIRPVNLGRG